MAHADEITPRSTPATIAPGATAPEIVLDISGMSCAACVTRVERAIRKVPGVAEVSVNLVTERATVAAPGAHVPADDTVQAIVQAIARAGYEAAPVPDETHAPPADDAPAATSVVADDAWRAQVSDGLQSLGWSARDAASACDNVAHLVEEDPQIGIAKLLRAALNSLARR